jgi:hypothetical protein
MMISRVVLSMASFPLGLDSALRAKTSTREVQRVGTERGKRWGKAVSGKLLDGGV